MLASLFGEECITKSRLLDSFKNYVSIDEKDTIINALQSFEESDELLELLSAYHCYKKAKKRTLKKYLLNWHIKKSCKNLDTCQIV